MRKATHKKRGRRRIYVVIGHERSIHAVILRSTQGLRYATTFLKCLGVRASMAFSLSYVSSVLDAGIGPEHESLPCTEPGPGAVRAALQSRTQPISEMRRHAPRRPRAGARRAPCRDVECKR